MKRKLIFATHNEGKVNEVCQILSGDKYDILSLKDLDIHDEVEENGTTSIFTFGGSWNFAMVLR